jgi:hypothetical protein
MHSITHIINPVAAKANTELGICQPIVFESIRRAKNNAAGHVQVELCTVQFAEDRPVIPGYFIPYSDLQRSTNELGLANSRKLPFVKEILESAYQNSASEYIIYSNTDIALMPYFYNTVNEIIEQGYDGFIINRRCISGKYTSISELELMYSDIGAPHIGYDCFVFKRELFPQFILADVCTGIPHAWTDLANNLFCFSSKFKLFTQKHLTFHIGMELYKNWGGNELCAHNKKEYMKVLKGLKPHFKIENIPGSNLNFFKRHFKWLMNPTFHYPTMLWLDLSQLGTKRQPREKSELRTLKNKYLQWLVKHINFD